MKHPTNLANFSVTEVSGAGKLEAGAAPEIRAAIGIREPSRSACTVVLEASDVILQEGLWKLTPLEPNITCNDNCSESEPVNQGASGGQMQPKSSNKWQRHRTTIHTALKFENQAR
jgi:hypothetical protein